MIRKHRRHSFRGLLVVGAVALSATVSACGGSDSGSASTTTPNNNASAVDTALATGGDLTVWAWEPTLKQVVTDFQVKYPKVHVKLVNAGTGNDQYTALQNAIKAGSGVPDVAQVEYYALPQFGLTKSLTNLKQFGTDSLADTFTPGPWNSVNLSGAVYGLPMDSGPMAMFYNQKVFDKAKAKVPTTWQEYLEAARAIHKADPKQYITSDTGDAGFTTSMIWQAGGKPYQVDGSKVTVNLADPGTKQFAQFWQQLINEKLLSPVVGWSDEWYKGLGDGTVASLVTGAWMPANFSGAAEAAKGDWRVAPMPQWSAGGKATAENGGSSLAVPALTKNAALAYGFVKYAATGAGAAARIAGGAFPATKADLTSPAFLAKKFPYFGDQEANRVLAASAAEVVPGWSYLPFQVYANSIFSDNVGQAYTGRRTLEQGLQQWADATKKYGGQQGFTIS